MNPTQTPSGLKIEGAYENKRNADNAQLFKDMIREAYGAGDVIIGHHLTYVKVDKQGEFEIQVVEEIPSADALIFDHEAAKIIWGDGRYTTVLGTLALLPVPLRDRELKNLYYGRPGR